MEPEEIWKATSVCDGRFEVSSFGNVRNTRTKRLRRQSSREGYRRVVLEGRFYSAHRLVAEAFLPQLPEQKSVNHKDGDKVNNHVSNLEWITHSGNIAHAYRHGLLKPKAGSRNGAAKLTEEQVSKIRLRYAAGGVRQADLAAEFGCCQHNISLIIRREKWAHV